MPLVPVHPKPRHPPHADGLKITLSGIGNGLTVNKQGRPLLQPPFVFQCPPLEQFEIVHSQNFGTYDTIDDDQFNRRGSRQLDTWVFDTLVMYLGEDDVGHHAPSWVPFPTPERAKGKAIHPPEWYRTQLVDLLNAGSPFRFVAAFSGSSLVRRTFAVLTGFSEVYKHGEGDAIYFAGVSFSEWRDPGNASKVKLKKVPGQVRFRITGGQYMAYEANTKHSIPARGKQGSTLSDLARWYYGDASKWRLIAKANNLKGGSGTTPIFTHWYPHKLARGEPNVTMNIPQEGKPGTTGASLTFS
jgi:hypothetical protein